VTESSCKWASYLPDRDISTVHGTRIRPSISVVMAARNCADTLEQAVMSALYQTLPPLQVIVVDDGSDDGTWRKLNTFKDDRILAIRNRRRLGRSASRNIALESATGELIAIADSDDISLPRRFELCEALFAGHPDIVASGGQLVAFDSRVSRCWRYPRWPTSAESIKEAFERGTMGIAHPTCLILRDAMRDVGGYNEALSYSEDFDLFLRLVDHGNVISTSEDVVIYRRSRYDSAGHIWRTHLSRREAIRLHMARKGERQRSVASDFLDTAGLTVHQLLRQVLKGGRIGKYGTTDRDVCCNGDEEATCNRSAMRPALVGRYESGCESTP
jgi:glycosyltransferase involved in cell wall biosynthesis